MDKTSVTKTNKNYTGVSTTDQQEAESCNFQHSKGTCREREREQCESKVIFLNLKTKNLNLPWKQILPN